MKIMFLVYSFTTGGTERLLIDICNELCKKNEVHLFIVNNLYDDTMLEKIDENVKVKLYNRKVGEKNILKTSYDISKYIKENDIKIVHCNSLNSPELVLISKIRDKNLKVYYTVHGLDQYNKLSKIAIRFRNIICNKIIAISNGVKEDILNSGASKIKVLVLKNAINTNDFIESSNEFDKNNIVIGCVARIEPSIKGQDILIKSIQKLKKEYPTVKCKLAGPVSDKNLNEFNELKKYVCEHNLENNIEFVGGISNVPHFLSEIDIFILPSRYEGFGLSLIEAMCMGIPCIASDTAGPKEIISDNNLGLLFENGKCESLADKIKILINNYEKYKQSSVNKISVIKEEYNITKMCERLLDIYKER